MLTGMVPFDDPSPTSLALQHLTLAPPPPRQINPALDEETEVVLLQALSKDPALRPASAGALMEALDDALHAALDRGAAMALPPIPAEMQGAPRSLSRMTVATGSPSMSPRRTRPRCILSRWYPTHGTLGRPLSLSRARSRSRRWPLGTPDAV